MTRPSLTIVVAASTNDVIGRQGALPWHLPADLKRFRDLTLGKPVIMGRSTHDSIGRPLPGRRNIVITRQRGLAIEGCEVALSPEAALALVADDPEAMIIGGGRIYAHLLPRCNRIHLTRVHLEVEGDTVFPALDPDAWRIAASETHAPGDGQPGFTFSTLERNGPS